MNAFSNLFKAAVSVALAPVAAVVDAACLPCDAYDRGDAFARSRGLIANAGRCVAAAVDPETTGL
jgi:hypothetical protein